MSQSSKVFTEDEYQEAREHLLRLLKPSDTVSVIQRHVTSSGMTRHLSLFIARGDRPIDITRDAAAVMGQRYYYDRSYNYLKVGGAGMDMHFHTVYSLSRALWPEGHECTGYDQGSTRCPSNDHSNDYNAARSLFDKKLADEGRERLYGNDEASLAQHEEFRAYYDDLMANGPLGFRKGRMHRDGGYALNKETF